MEKEKEILPGKKWREIPGWEPESLDINLTLIWHSVKRQGRRTQIGKGLIRALVKPPKGILLLSLASPSPLRRLERTRLSSLAFRRALPSRQHLGLGFQDPAGLYVAKEV